MAAFVIHTKDIDADGKPYSFPIEASWLAGVFEGTDLRAAPESEDGKLELFAQRSGADILVTGTIEANVVADCVRCLEDAAIDVRVEMGSLFSARTEGTRPEPQSADDDLTPEDLAREFFTGDDIELDEVVRDNIILEMPMQPLCKEDCAGIAVPDHVRPPDDFGHEQDDDGVDPRLAGLKDIAAQLSAKKE